MLITETSESDKDVTSYVIGCSVVGGMLLAGLCTWIYYTNIKHPKNKNKNKKFFTVNPAELATIKIIPGGISNDYYSPYTVVPIVNMLLPDLQERSRRDSSRKSSRVRGNSFLSSVSARSGNERVKSTHSGSFFSRNNSIWSSWSDTSVGNRVRTRSDSIVRSLEEGSSMYSLPSELSDLSDISVLHEKNEQIVLIKDDVSNCSSVGSVSTESADTNYDSA